MWLRRTIFFYSTVEGCNVFNNYSGGLNLCYIIDGTFIGVENISLSIILFFSRTELFLFSFLVGTISANFMTTWRRKRFSLQVSCGDNISGMWLFKVTKHRWLNPRAGKVKRILCCDWLLERARWAPLGSRKKTFSFWQYNKTFVDLVWSQDGWLLAFFDVFVGLGAVSVYKIRNKSPGQYSAILNSRRVNNAYIY